MQARFPKPHAEVAAAARVNDEQVAAWAATMSDWLKVNHPTVGLAGVRTGADAWTVASRSGVLHEAYKDRAMTDGHVQTALEKIFPNAAFRDKKRW